MRVKSKFIWVTAAIAVMISFFSVLTSGGASFASAAASSYTNVMTDLTKDEKFNPADYSENVNDYSLNVIQIAESSDDELFIYVHQPSGQRVDLKASSINIAKQENNSLEMSFPNYPLTLINSNGVFYKYKVDGFELEKTAVRYYNISNILRPFKQLIDTPPAVGTIKEVPNAVGQLWTVRTVDDNVEYAKTDSEVVTITQKYVGFLRYLDSIDLEGVSGITGRNTIRNFVAFSTDRPIDQLKQVELQYALADCSYEYCANMFHTGSSADDPHKYQDRFNDVQGTPVTQDPVVIRADETDENAAHGWWGHKYTWDKIQSTSDFLAEQRNQEYKLINAAGVNSIEGTQWVLNFYKETRVVTGKAGLTKNHLYCDYTAVSDVIILRLMFEYDGHPYNLGVVDSKMTGDDKPLNGPASPLPGIGIGSGCAGTGCNFALPKLPWWVYVIIAVSAIVALILIGWIGTKIVSIIFGGGGSGSSVHQIKREQRNYMRVLRHQAKLERKEENRRRKLAEKDAKKAQKAKDKQAAMRRKKATQSKNKKGKGGKKK